jgi:hypothetical protein
MADAGGKSDWKKQIIPRKDSFLDMIRVACYVHQISEAGEMIEYCPELGYETTLNIMAISVASDREISEALSIGARTPAGPCPVDLFGAGFPPLRRPAGAPQPLAEKGPGSDQWAGSGGRFQSLCLRSGCSAGADSHFRWYRSRWIGSLDGGETPSTYLYPPIRH